MQKRKFLVSTDLDGTLLDHSSYSWKPAKQALDQLKNNQIPIVINTSKTCNEVVRLQQDLSLVDPFIVENGSAVYIHELDSRFDLSDTNGRSSKVSVSADIKLHEFILGKSREHIYKILRKSRSLSNWSFTGFKDMGEAELAELTGLPIENAAAAKNRYFSEPILWQDSKDALLRFEEFLSDNDLTLLQGGRFYHVLGSTNKGMAIDWLRQRMLIREPVLLVALGDTYNDLDMLKIADYPVLVKSPAHDFPKYEHQNLIRTEAKGPSGWNEAIMKIIA